VTARADSPDKWDFFVSYSSQVDQPWAEWVAWELEEIGYKVLIQAWDFVPGSNWIQSMQVGIREANRTIAVLSEAYLESAYGTAEWQAAWAKDPAGVARKLLVVRVTACERPGLLAGVVGVDLVGLAEPTARARLREMIASAVNGRAKPAAAPAFPAAKRARQREPRFPGAPPTVWRVPLRNPNFTGRSRERADLVRALSTRSKTCVQVLRGMSGLGKSGLAIEYAHAHAGRYDVVWQIAAKEPDLIPGQFRTLATELDLEPALDEGTLRLRVYNRLCTVSSWLLIFDDADQVEDMQRWLPTCPQPAGIAGHVIITTRRGGFAALGQVMDLDPLELPDALELLRTRVPDMDQEVGEEIAEKLGRLPLALERAADFMDRSQLPGLEYLALLQTCPDDLYVQSRVTGPKDPFTLACDIAIKRIRGKSKAAVQLLDICAYLTPRSIPLKLFTAHADLLPEPLASVVRDPLAWNQAVGMLIDHSMAKRSPGSLELHPLVQAAIRARNFKLIRKPTGNPLGAALALLRAEAPGAISDAPHEWLKWEALLPHVLAAIGHFDPIAGQPANSAMADAAWLQGRAATYLQTHGRLTEAKTMLECAVAMTEAACSPDHPEVANQLNNLATVLRDLGRPEAARSLMERVLAIDEATYGHDHPEVATDMNNLAASLRDLGQPEAARPLMEGALKITQRVYGYDHPVVAIRLGNLAMILRDLGELEAAHSLQERALAIDEAVFGPSHPAVARGLNNLALILYDIGKHESVRPLMERALGITRAVYGARHPIAVASLNKLLGTLQDMKYSNTAYPIRERTLTVR
jgi:tetratricopeptide (TPR) repeat protein